MSFDYTGLRNDMMDYYGTAAFSGMPAAMMDVINVESMNDCQLYSYACSNGIDMRKYDTQELFSVPAFVSAVSRSSTPYSTVYVTKDIRELLPLSDRARKIMDNKPDFWEYLLVAQCMEDNSVYLSKWRKPSRNNPLVRIIGDTGTGCSTLGYVMGIVNNMAEEVDLIDQTMKSIAPEFEKAFGEDGEDGDPELLVQVCRRYMEPYISMLGIYIDIMTIKSSFPSVFDELEGIVGSMLDACEQYYRNIYRDIPRAIRGENVSLNFTLSFPAFSTDKLLSIIKGNAEAIANDKISRKHFLL